MELQTEITATEREVVRNEEEIPLEAYEIEAQPEIPEGAAAQPEEVIPTPLETTDEKTQTVVLAIKEASCQTEEASQFREQSAIIDRLEAELVQAQQALTQTRDEMVTMEEHQRVC
jgi:hypothetical protein